KSAIVSGKTAAIAKFDRDNKDELDIWSQLRAKEASKINARLQKNALRNSLLGAYNSGGWNMFGTFGLWVFDPYTGRWCFLPFGGGWNSPYGYSYGFNIYNCQLPPVVYTPPVTPTTPTATGQMTPEQVQIREERRQSAQTPTFQRFENNQRNETRGGSRDNDNSEGGGGWNNGRGRSDSNDSRPTYAPTQSTPSQSTPAPSAPTTRDVPTRTETKDVKDN
ncbi:MAG TPA: hypothetical protein VNB22_16835, partial [Pyrinomonadaceae bacterium]|nr:hypothetical protein [Pyrinomonadaceae bacterium]